MPYSLSEITLLIIVGLIAGVINTLAGGGSFLSLPLLMMLGLPADVANATNRVSVVFQSFTASHSFYQKHIFVWHDVKRILLPTIIGGLIGALLASFTPLNWLKPLLLITMIMSAFWIVLKSDTQPNQLNEQYNTRGFLALLLAGVYGGFVQAGVGFVLISALVGVISYDLIKANALKAVAALIFTIVALAVFIVRDQIWWVPGLILAIGSIAGAKLGVNLAIKVSPFTLKILILMMTIVASIAALVL